ncbi:hypothetical protein [Angustibacter sp. Root456]|uniref:hypothetical protein n=1 Tax=Angustibacter sp. Root456 TaxID=1736539 RepID=UPI0006F81F9B|nr:hypothetical protein [Angustibacter sp. Root456]KQX68820.1 hypothetical protein ASD06_17130 [Angustibacter sp. Root456]
MVKRGRPVDPAVYADVMAAALVAYRVDVGYAVAMASRASVIIRKRLVYEVRAQIREAVTGAIQECSCRPQFRCDVPEACGLGSCPFASPDFADVTTPATSVSAKSGKTFHRPQPGLGPRSFGVEPLIRETAAKLLTSHLRNPGRARERDGSPGPLSEPSGGVQPLGWGQ